MSLPLNRYCGKLGGGSLRAHLPGARAENFGSHVLDVMQQVEQIAILVGDGSVSRAPLAFGEYFLGVLHVVALNFHAVA